jgi:H+/gluconate symporter-like permease
MGILGIIVGLVLVVVLTYKGLNVIIGAPLCAAIVILFNLSPENNYTLLRAFQTNFLPGSGGFIGNMMAFYLAGGMFGAVYNKSGAAKSIGLAVINLLRGKDANKKVSPFAAIMIVFIACFVLGYGGVHVVTLIFIMIPLAIEVLKAANIPMRMAPGLVIGAGSSYVLCLPGSPQTQNAWATAIDPNGPLSALKGESFDALVPGFSGGLVAAILSIIYLTWAAKKEMAIGPDDFENQMRGKADTTTEGLPNPIVALIPLIVLFVLFNVFKVYLPFAVCGGIVLGLILFSKQLGIKNIPQVLGDGVSNICAPMAAGAVMGGFGAVVAGCPAFVPIRDSLGTFSGPPLLVVTLSFIAITIVAGSGPAALGSGYPAFGQIFLNMGVSSAAIHRLSAFASVTFDDLPTNAVFLASTGLTGYPVNKTYKHVGICSIVNTTIGTFVVMLMCMALGF